MKHGYSNGGTLRMIVAAAVPPIILGFCFAIFLGHRSDYLGHFLAGYGGTLGAIVLGVASASSHRTKSVAPARIGFICIACIGLGAAIEATIFRIAIFDRVDFANQSIGAVLAGLGCLAAIDNRTQSSALGAGFGIACIALLSGFYFAFA